MNALRLIQTVRTWPVTSQQTARRNALVASTALTRRRLERQEVAAYVEAAAARHEVRTNLARLASGV